MTELLQWLLDLDRIQLARDAPILFKWQDALPAWALACCGLAAALWVGLVYRRERTTGPRRLVLAGLRLALLALVIAMICQPALVLQRNRVEPAHVALLIDTSRSMGTAESYVDAELAGHVAAGAGLTDPARVAEQPRLELVRRALLADDARALRVLLQRNGLELSTFAGAAQAEAYAATPEELDAMVARMQSLQPEGSATDTAGAIRFAMEEARGRRVAAIVMASDGRSTDPFANENLTQVLELARGRRIPVYTLRIGSPYAPPDIEVGPLRAQEAVFINDILAVEAQVAAHGLTEPLTVTARMLDERDEAVVASESVQLDPTSPSAAVELRTKPTRTGRVQYRVEVAPLEAERVVDNNADRVQVTVLDDRLKVLYVEGYPRYEYRYLKEALRREKSIDVSVLLLEADEEFVQEGTEPIRRFPETPEELNRYDVVIFGDVDPRGGLLTPAQMTMLLDFVGNRGGGFVLIAGERAAPHRYLGTPLERLVPVRIDPTFLGRYDEPLVNGFSLTLTPEGAASRVFRFTADRAETVRVAEALPQMFWIARTLGPRPGAMVLAEHPALTVDGQHMPLVVTGRYGAGKLYFQATDDTWLWRRHSGELLHDTYWVRVAREMMQSERVGADRRYAIRTDRRVYEFGQPVRAQVELFDTQLLTEDRRQIPLVIYDTDERPVARLDAERLEPASALYEAVFTPTGSGRFVVRADDLPPPPGEQAAEAAFRVEDLSLETRRLEADHDALARIADTTGGRFMHLDELPDALAEIQDRSVQIPDDITEPLWDSRLALLLFVLMILMEWILRKAFGLL